MGFAVFEIGWVFVFIGLSILWIGIHGFVLMQSFILSAGQEHITDTHLKCLADSQLFKNQQILIQNLILSHGPHSQANSMLKSPAWDGLLLEVARKSSRMPPSPGCPVLSLQVCREQTIPQQWGLPPPFPFCEWDSGPSSMGEAYGWGCI